jgi:hypothetical protein
MMVVALTGAIRSALFSEGAFIGLSAMFPFSFWLIVRIDSVFGHKIFFS